MSQIFYPAYRFITAVVSPYISKDEILPQLTRQSSLHWEAVANLAGNHSVVQLLYPAILEKDLVNHVPDDFMSYIQHMNELNCQRNSLMKSQLMDAVSTINQLGIEPLLMKGAAQLFLNTFSNPGDRLLTDLDILVPHAEIERISNGLIATGYQYSGDRMEFKQTHHHYPPLIKEGECSMLELHRDLIFQAYQHAFPTNDAWKQTITITLPNKAQAKILNPTYRVFHSYLHSYMVDELYNKGYAEIRQLHELTRSILTYSSDIDWQEMFNYAKKHNVDKQLSANLYITNKFMKIPSLEKINNKHTLSSILQYARVCAKLKYSSFDNIDKKLSRHVIKWQRKK